MTIPARFPRSINPRRTRINNLSLDRYGYSRRTNGGGAPSRRIRVVEIEKQEQRTRSANRRFSLHEMSADAWDALDLQDMTPLVEWLRNRPECTSAVNIPDERPAVLSPSPMFDPNAVYFGKERNVHVDCRSLAEAKLTVQLENAGVTGYVEVPAEEAGCVELCAAIGERVRHAKNRFWELAESRNSDEDMQTQIVDQLLHWLILGRTPENERAGSAVDE